MHTLCVYTYVPSWIRCLIIAPRDLLCVATIMLLYCTFQASSIRKDGVTVVYFQLQPCICHMIKNN